MPFGASPQDWTNLDLILGLTGDLLPVVSDPHAPISPNSEIKAKGKVPSRYNNARQIAGIADWTSRKSSSKDIEAWSKDPDYGICIQTRRVRALDIDVEKSQAIIDYIATTPLGRCPFRTRNNSGKLLIAFTLKGEFPKRTLKVGGGMIEFLGNGQQFVCIGTHPSGVRYEGFEGVEAIPELTVAQFEAVWQDLVNRFGVEPPSEDSIRNARRSTPTLNDPVAAYLEASSLFRSTGKEQQIFIHCPFKAEHTGDSGKTETAYFRKGSRDYAEGHFKCLHAHCAAREDDDFLQAAGYVAAGFDALPEEHRETLKQGKFQLYTPLELTQRPKTAWLIKGLVPRCALGMTYGGSGDGKTFAVLDRCIAIAIGVPWNGRKTSKGRVVYICAEGQGGFASRIEAYCIAHSTTVEQISQNLRVITDVPNFRTEADAKAIIERIKEWGDVDFITVDTLGQTVTGADENSGKDMSVPIKIADTMRNTLRCSVELIHHAGKDEDRGARGWSGMKGPLDYQFWIYRGEGEERVCWVAKQKDSRDGYGWNFNLVTLEVGRDEDNEPIESCSVNWVGDASGKKAPKKARLGGNEQIVMNAFNVLGGEKVEGMRLFEEARKELPFEKGTQDNRTRNIGRAIATLVDKGILARGAEGFLTTP